MPPPTRNPPNRFSLEQVVYDEAPPAELTVLEETARSILSENESPDVGFRFSINPYRGCAHGCAYCYARPTHAYLGHGAGSDFERKIVVKVNAPELLEEAFERPSWRGETIAFSGNTDCYQPLEARYGLTRRLLETCLRYRNPVAVITKGALVRRDVDLLAALAREARCRVTMSIAFADDATARAIEPWASPPSRRLDALARLAEAGIPCGVSLAPLVPGLNDGDVVRILERAKEAGASHAFTVLLRLPAEVLPVWDERLREAFPGRHARVMAAIHEMRGGRAYESAFHQRQVGRGERYRMLARTFELHAARLGLRVAMAGEVQAEGPAAGPRAEATTFRRPRSQLDLFEG